MATLQFVSEVCKNLLQGHKGFLNIVHQMKITNLAKLATHSWLVRLTHKLLKYNQHLYSGTGWQPAIAELLLRISFTSLGCVRN